MDERDVAQLFIAEMRALLPVVQRHLDTLSGAFTTEAQRQVAGNEISRLATAMADLCSGFHAEDCAFLSVAIATAYEDERLARLPGMTMLAATADILTYLHMRMQLMAEHSRVLAPNDAERDASNRLLSALRGAQQRVTRELPPYPTDLSRDAHTSTASSSPLSASRPPEPIPQDPHESIAASGVPSAGADAPLTLAALASELGQMSPVSNGAHPSLDVSGDTAYSDSSLSQLSEEDRALLEVFRHSELLTSRAPAAPVSPVVTSPLPELHDLEGAPAAISSAALSIPALAATAPAAQQETQELPPDSDIESPASSGAGAATGAGVAPDASLASPASPHPAGAPSRPLVAHPLTADDLDVIPPEMHRIFVSETTTDIQDLRRALLRYEEDQDDGMLGEISRIAHKVKGNAATLNFLVFAELTLVFEDIVTAFSRQPAEIRSEAVAALVQGIDLLQGALDAVKAVQEVDPALVQRANALRDILLTNASDAGDTPVHLTPSAFVPPVVASATTSEDNQGVGSRQMQPGSDAHEPLLRVDVHRLNDLIKHVSALALNRAALTQARKEMDKLQDELEHSLTRLSVLGGDFSDLHGLLVHMSAPQKDDEPRDAARSSSSRFGFNLFGLGGRSVQQSGAGAEPASEAAQAARDHLSTLLGTAGNVYASPMQRRETRGLELERYTEVDHALRSLNEVVADVTTTSRTLRGVLMRLSQVSEEQAGLAGDMQHDVMRIRLVPLAELTPRLHFEVRRVQQVAGKKITFTTSGEQTEIDRNISEALAEPLIQLVRNAILHGIESPSERIQQGKSEAGSIWLHAYYTNSDVIIEVGDDGRGVNPFGLAGVAFTNGYIDAETARNMSYTEALDLMFLPGVTTFDEAQTLGGRGVGLDQVRTAIQQLKGTISVQSEQGKGSIFRIRVPISLSIVRSLQVRAGNQQFAIPFTSVQRTLSLVPGDVLASASGPHPPKMRIRIERLQPAHRSDRQLSPPESAYEEIPAFVLTDLLGFERRPHDSQMALIIELGRQRAALLIDDVVTEQELVVQVLPRHLRRRSLRGATVTPDGQLLLLLDVQELVTAALDDSRPRRVAPPVRSAPPRPSTLAPRVLVVDDSVSIRGTLERVLYRAGFEVQVARDGIEALETMLVSPPSVMVLDIEMPRLDGFELLSIVRGSHQFAGVRVVMLTSRAAEVHRARALSLGAAAYLIKPCPNDILVETIRSLLMEPAITR